MTRSLAGVERPNVCNRLEPLLLIISYTMLYSFGVLAAVGRHNTVGMAVGFDIGDVIF